MLLIVISAATVVFCIVLVVVEKSKAYFGASFASILCLLISSVCFAIEVLLAFATYVGSPAYLALNEQRYESLVYQLENNLYDNDNDLGKKKLYDQIQDWNEDLAAGKKMQHDIWVGIFWADIYDHFDFIDMERYNTN